MRIEQNLNQIQIRSDQQEEEEGADDNAPGGG